MQVPTPGSCVTLGGWPPSLSFGFSSITWGDLNPPQRAGRRSRHSAKPGKWPTRILFFLLALTVIILYR